MKHQYSLKIDSPCSENWNEMLPSDNGRFCLHCQKTVIDFSEMTDYEVSAYLHHYKNENLCGKIRNSQSEKTFIFVEPQLTSSPVKRYVMAMLTAFMVVSPIAANSSPLPVYSLVQTNTQTEKPPLKDSTVLNSISGILTDKETGKPIPYATVVLSVNSWFGVKVNDNAMPISKEEEQAQKERYLRIKELNEVNEMLRKTPIFCKTDANGYFYLALPNDFQGMDFLLNIRLLNKRVKDEEGKESFLEERRINPLLVHYKGGHYYKEMAVQIEKKEIFFRMGMVAPRIAPPTEIND